MFCKPCLALAGAAMLTLTGSLTLGAMQDAKPTSPPTEVPLPPGWTEADMKACMDAGTPGDMHKYLAEGVGVWHGKTTMWMAPGADPTYSECNSIVTSIMDGRYIKCEMESDMNGMPFEGFGLYGFDNVSQQFQTTWIDSFSTGIMHGKGERSYDGSKMTWTYKYTCPITKKLTTLREVETINDANSRTLEMFGIDPKGGKEFKMMEIKFTRGASLGTGAGRVSGGR